MVLKALLGLGPVPILVGSMFHLPHSTAKASGLEVPQTEVGDEKEASA